MRGFNLTLLIKINMILLFFIVLIKTKNVERFKSLLLELFLIGNCIQIIEYFMMMYVRYYI